MARHKDRSVSSQDRARPSADTNQSRTITIYQDAAHIEGILQQTNKGLLTASTQSNEMRDTHTLTDSSDGSAELSAELKLPGAGGIRAGGKLSEGQGGSTEGLTGRHTTQDFRYTSAYYLHHVRQDLREANLLKPVSSANDLRSLGVGDFVEFGARFAPDELISLMDVFNPEMIAALIKWIHRKRIIDELTDATDEGDRQSLIVEFQTRPDSHAELAKAIAEAVRVDFRSAATRQYYAEIVTDPVVTAVVVCDLRSFLVDDPDRILDGNFTILGKVTTPPEEDVPILARNKVLDRIQPGAVDFVMEELRKMARKQVETSGTISGDQDRFDDYIDLDFPSRIKGKSFKVIPIAIYI